MSVLKQGGLLEAKPVHSLLQVLILLADVAEIEVVLPEVRTCLPRWMEEPFGRGDEGCGPEPNESHAFAIARIEAHVS